MFNEISQSNQINGMSSPDTYSDDEDCSSEYSNFTLNNLNNDDDTITSINSSDEKPIEQNNDKLN